MTKPKPPMPSKADLIAFISERGGDVDKREIARAFHLRGQDKILLKQMLRELEREGTISKLRKRFTPPGALPPVALLVASGPDGFGDIYARPLDREGAGEPPRIFVKPQKGRGAAPALGAGDRFLGKIEKVTGHPGHEYEARVIRLVEEAPARILGVFHSGAPEGRVEPADKRIRHPYVIPAGEEKGAKDGELVLFEPMGRGRSALRARGRIVERLGDLNTPRSISLIAIHTHGIPVDFPAETERQAEAAVLPPLTGRTDLRALPLVTIDPEDARDHDDAVHAAPDTDPANPGGHILTVAIADVAYYVTPGSPLDKEARLRGNSTYFPDRVVPMLPEALSSGLCSLKENEERACLAVEMVLSAEGKKLRHRFMRGIMRSAARLSYGEAQKAIDGFPSEKAEPLIEPVLKPLYATYAALKKARDARQPLDLDLPEKRILLNPEGKVLGIEERERLDAHKLVEECMIAANVAAAEELNKHRTPTLFRIHEAPPMDKMEVLREFLGTLDLSLPKGQVMHPRLFNGVLAKVAGTPQHHLVNTVILRSQTQAYYGPENLAHFGLALSDYVHFTSPIRRYSDIIVHRGLIRALKLGSGGLLDEEITRLPETGEAISRTERRSMTAERDATDAYLAAYLEDRVGDAFTGRITGVSRFGLFVSLEPSGGDGLIPISSMRDDYYWHDEAAHMLTGRHTRKHYQLGGRVDVILVEANKYTGALRLELSETGTPAPSHGKMRGKTLREGKRTLPKHKKKIARNKNKA